MNAGLIRRYGAFARIAARQRLRDRGAFVGRMGFYALIVFIFSRLWDVVLAKHPIDGLGPEHFVWYLAITEWIVLSIPLVNLDVEEDVRSGDLAYRITRPLPYPATRLAEAIGDLVVRMAVLGAFGFVLAWWITGTIPIGPLAFATLLPLGLLAAVVSLVFYVGIGLTAFWIHDTRPVYWMWQKAAFVLGGLMVPLSLYPDWLRPIAEWSPFAAILFGPARIGLGADPAFAALVAVKLLGWLVVAAALVAWTYRRGLRTVTIGGG
jgi:ABC-2 type transport system permease protein